MVLLMAVFMIELYGLIRIRKEKMRAFADSVFYTLVWIYINTELLSLLRLLTRKMIIISWIIICVLLLFFIIKAYRNDTRILSEIETTKEKKYRVTHSLFCLLFVGVVLFSIISITSNWDSMTYHMPRIMHWIQNRTVNFYATNEPRQIFSNPFSEYVILHNLLLQGNDKYVCLVQGMSYVISVILVYCVTRKMGAKREYAYLASFLFALMPPAIAEAVTTQNDLFSTLILLLFFYYYLDFIQYEYIQLNKSNILLAIKFAVTIALGYLAKSNVCIIMACLIIVLAVYRLLRRDNIGNLIKILLIGMVSAILGVLPFSVRSLRLYGSVIPKAQMDSVSIQTTSISTIFINCYKNIAKYMLIPCLPPYNALLSKIGYKLGAILRIDINDPLISPYEFILPSELGVYHHDMATNPVVIYLCIFVIILLIMGKCKRISIESAIFIASVSGLICTSAIARYSPWKIRYFLPVSGVIIVASIYQLEKANIHQIVRGVLIAFIIILSVFSGMGAFYYNAKSVLKGYRYDEFGRYAYFVQRTGIRKDYYDIANYINSKNYHSIGLYMVGDSYEYPLWNMLDNVEKIEHVNVQDSYLSRLEDKQYLPECIITIGMMDNQIDRIFAYNGKEYVCKYVSEDDNTNAIYEIQK